MEFSASRASSSADSDSLTAQNANLQRENGLPNKTNVDLLESLKQLSEKVKNLLNKEQIKVLLAENDKVEKMLLDHSTTTLMTKLCITENGNGEVTGELGRELSEQLTKVQKLQSELNAKTALWEQVTNDLCRKNMALDETLSLVKENRSQREELNKLRTLNSELQAELEIEKEKAVKNEENLNKYKNKLAKENYDLSVKINLWEAAEDMQERAPSLNLPL